MNGVTDNGEVVTQNHFRTILGHAWAHHLARLTFWSLDRDRPCTGGGAGHPQRDLADELGVTRILAARTG